MYHVNIYLSVYSKIKDRLLTKKEEMEVLV